MGDGEWGDGRRVVVVEFPDRNRLNAWYSSQDSAEALTIRADALDRRVLFVHGV